MKFTASVLDVPEGIGTVDSPMAKPECQFSRHSREELQT